MLGIGPGEFFLILIILLVVVGPERLPGFARQAGKFIIGVRNWIQRSPDAQLILRARDELEQELRAIRTDLTQEMESVRKEMETVRQEMIEATREATSDAVKQIDDAAVAGREATQAATAKLTEPLKPAVVSQPVQTLPSNLNPVIDLEARKIAPPQMLSETAEVHVAETTDALAEAAETPETTVLVSEAGEPLLEVPAPVDVIEAAASAPEVPELLPETVNVFESPKAPEVPPLANGQPVARTTRPGAPVVASAEAQMSEPVVDAPVETPLLEAPLRAEVDSMKQQLLALTTELRALQEQIHHIRGAVPPRIQARQAEEPPVVPEPQPEEVA